MGRGTSSANQGIGTLAERNAVDDAEARAQAQARQLSPNERLAQALDLDAARALARSVGARWLDQARDDLGDKARRTPMVKD